ncbi:MAG TPA: AAA family ATPase [Tepidisphaeraceae bacterium]|nr:AAA family ATPase [Tepidisphaeraceae bacterium]
MYTHLNCIVVDADPTNRAELASFLSQYGANVSAQLNTTETLPGMLSRADAPQLVIVNLDPGAHESLKKIAHLPRQHANISFFLMSQVLDANLLMEAMHLGVKEFIPLPMSVDKFTAALDRVSQMHGAAQRAKVIHVIPTVGGCGSTTVSCNIAASLAKAGKAAILDLDLMRGGVANSFDLRPRYTIADVMDSADKVDKQLLDNALTIHAASGLAVLARPDLPEDTQRVNPPGVARLMGVVGRMFDYVVVDSMMSIAPMYTTVVHAADTNIIVMQLNVPSAKNAERFVGALRRMGIESSKIKIVVNRYEKRNRDIEPDEVERALGLKISWLVPNDFKNAIAAINFGEPAVLRSPKAEMSTSLRDLANMLATKDQGTGRSAA